VALVVPDQEFAKTYAKAEGKRHHLEELAKDDDFQEVIGAVMKRANQRLSPIERIRRFKIMPEPFSIENGAMTPTLKLKRQIIYKRHEEAIAALYKGRVS
jgi:long-chain acyl-CoA synthetase